jgi:hypothetical protein
VYGRQRWYEQVLALEGKMKPERLGYEGDFGVKKSCALRLLVIGISFPLSRQVSYEDKAKLTDWGILKGKRFGYCIGAVGMQRDKGKLLVLVQHDIPLRIGIETKPFLHDWQEYNKSVEKGWQARCLSNVVLNNQAELSWQGVVDTKPTAGDRFKEQLENFLIRRQIVFEIRKSGRKDRWYPCRLVVFDTKKGEKLIPLKHLKDPRGKLLKEFKAGQKKWKTEQHNLIMEHWMKMAGLNAEILELMPIGPFGPDFAALGPGPRRERIVAMQREFMRERIELQWRGEYVFRLSNAR